MDIREILKREIDILPPEALRDVGEYIEFKKYRSGIDETEYLCSVPGMKESLLEGMKEPIEECAPYVPSEEW